MISSGKCLMLFLRQDSSFGPSVDRIFFFSLGEGGGGRLFNIFSLKGGANSKGGGGAYLKEGANSSIYGTSTCYSQIQRLIDNSR